MSEKERLAVVVEHKNAMESNLRMLADAERMLAFPSADRFRAIAAQHAAIMTALIAVEGYDL